MTSLRLRHVVVVLALVAGLGLGWWMFRTSTADSGALGIVKYQWRWGKPYAVTMDRNRDGSVDLRCTVNTRMATFSPHTSPKECWIDIKYRGWFDHHVVFSHGQPAVVELLTAAGKPERRLSGDAAVRYYTALDLLESR